MLKSTLPRVAVLGAGPVGLEAAVYAKSLGLPVAVYEQAAVATNVERWGFVKMFSPFGMNVSALGKQLLLREMPTREFPADTELLTGREYRDAYLLPLVQSNALRDCLRTESRVMSIGRGGWRKTDTPDSRKPLPPFRLLIRDAKGVERFETADVILDCTGTLSRPNWVGDGGIPAVGEIAARQLVPYWVEDVLNAKKAAYAGKSIVVIGGGYSAATTVCDLVTLADEHQSTWIIWLTHGSRTAPLPRIANDPLKERDRLAVKANNLAARCDGNLEYHAQTQIDEVLSHGPDKGFRVSARVAGKPMTWDVERVIATVGYRADLTVCSELRVEEPGGQIATNEPGYFILGTKTLNRDSNFLIRDGHEQIRKAFASIMSKPALDLYRVKAA